MKASGRGGQPGHVHIDRQELVDALHDAVDVVHAARVGARSHRDDPARLHHLLVELLDDRRHLDEHGAGDHHQIGLARGRRITSAPKRAMSYLLVRLVAIST